MSSTFMNFSAVNETVAIDHLNESCLVIITPLTIQ